MTGAQGTSSSNLNSLDPAPLGVRAIPAASPAAPPVMDDVTPKNSSRSPLSLWMELGDTSETSTVCDIAVDTSLIEDLEAAVRTEADRGVTEADDSANVRRWKEEIDMLLVFAGLFSGVVTGFLTESTKSLRPEPTADTVAIFEHISAQLLDHKAIPDLVPSHETVQINCLWFLSLILSLGVAFVSILIKWWLQGHSSCLALSRAPEKRARAAHPQHAVWRVQAIMTALPILLLVALVLFCAGLSILLITLDTTVRAVAMCLIGFVFLFLSATTIFLSQK
ncbi:hypothetical protein V8D89_013395 [Ganoderma adspersum]